jgi:hypothetical protein
MATFNGSIGHPVFSRHIDSIPGPETTILQCALDGSGELHGIGSETQGSSLAGLVSRIHPVCDSDFIEGPSPGGNHMRNVSWLIFESFTR